MESSLHESLVDCALQTTKLFTCFSVQDFPKPIPDSLFTMPLGNGLFHKIAQTLVKQDTDLKIQALTAANDSLHRPENVAMVVGSRDTCLLHNSSSCFMPLFADVFAELAMNLEDQDDTVRRLSSSALLLIASERLRPLPSAQYYRSEQRCGRETIISHGDSMLSRLSKVIVLCERFVLKLAQTLSDRETAVRKNGYLILTEVCEAAKGDSALQFTEC